MIRAKVLIHGKNGDWCVNLTKPQQMLLLGGYCKNRNICITSSHDVDAIANLLGESGFRSHLDGTLDLYDNRPKGVRNEFYTKYFTKKLDEIKNITHQSLYDIPLCEIVALINDGSITN